MSDLAQGWADVPDDEADAVWDRFTERFAFRPGTDPRRWPGITVPDASVTWDLAATWQRPDRWPPGTPLSTFDVDTGAVERLVMGLLRDCTEPAGFVYALDWQHAAYRCSPHGVDLGDVDGWPVPVVPNGDYHVFLDPGFRFGVFGPPWEATLCLFGEPLTARIAALDIAALPPTFRRQG